MENLHPDTISSSYKKKKAKKAKLKGTVSSEKSIWIGEVVQIKLLHYTVLEIFFEILQKSTKKLGGNSDLIQKI